ncbi:MAG: glycoside hydrolase family 38 C-terminal domain-containing protein [Planctomycetota bacterium]
MLDSASLVLVVALGLQTLSQDASDTCLLFAGRCLARGADNFYLYQLISEQSVEIRPGDRLAYELFIPPDAPSPKGGIEVLFGAQSLRDSPSVDEQGRRAHGDTLLTDAVGRWIERRIDLTRFAGKKTSAFLIQSEGDESGLHVQFLDNVRIVHADGSLTPIYENGLPAANRAGLRSGYSQRSILQPVPRARITARGDFASLLDEAGSRQEIYWQHEDLQRDIELAETFLKADGLAGAASTLRGVLDAVPPPDSFQGTRQQYAAAIRALHPRLDQAHSVMSSYTGHLVGHGHIDPQWLWEWPEGIEVTRETFAQACRFMEEFPEFTFSQSSALLYAAIEEHYLELFEEVRQRVAEGRFEVVGGRWCEGDTNILSAESHARQFLHAQRYFRDKFGEATTVGFEPDTFGHVATMPQMLRLAGIECYYFSRCGRGSPLFWWEGPDGSRVLAFDEAASGSWYNSDVTEAQISELIEFRKTTGLKEMLWVYGVGNHGGGPTRENIERAIQWQQETGRPRVRFSTLRAFFETVREQDLSHLPVVKDELNFIFPGCYTTHGDIKRLNRDAEVALVAAETAALLASHTGFPVPHTGLARAWKDLLANHHHDTLNGTSVHDSYDYPRLAISHVIEYANWVTSSALRHLARRVEDEGEGMGVLVFNPLGWERDGLVELELSGDEASKSYRAIDPRGLETACQVTRDPSGSTRLLFVAREVPPFGYGVWRLVEGEAGPGSYRVTESPSAIDLETRDILASVDRASGVVTRFVDKATGRDLFGGRPANTISAFLEEPHSMSAWEIGEIKGVLPLEGLEAATIVEDGPVRVAVKVQRRFRDSTVTQWIRLSDGLPRLDFETLIDWRERGGREVPGPMLRASFPTVPGEFEARYSIPFGDKVRAADGAEVPALTWASLMGRDGGIALLNDCKHGHSATPDGYLRLTLVRSSYSPDPLPDQYLQFMTFSVVPLQAGGRPAVATRAGFELNYKLRPQRLLQGRDNAFADYRAAGAIPATGSLLALVDLEGVIPTCLKPSEDGKAAILRFYEANGAEARGSIELGFAAGQAQEVNLIEDPLSDPQAIEHGQVGVRLRPFEIKTLRLE